MLTIGRSSGTDVSEWGSRMFLAELSKSCTVLTNICTILILDIQRSERHKKLKYLGAAFFIFSFELIPYDRYFDGQAVLRSLVIGAAHITVSVIVHFEA